MIINIKELINSEFAVSPEDGDIVYDKVKGFILRSEKVNLDFSNLDLITTAFLNNAIGKLLGKFNSDKLNQFVKFENISDSDLFLLKKVIERAKMTFDKENQYTEIIKEEFKDE